MQRAGGPGGAGREARQGRWSSLGVGGRWLRGVGGRGPLTPALLPRVERWRQLCHALSPSLRCSAASLVSWESEMKHCSSGRGKLFCSPPPPMRPGRGKWWRGLRDTGKDRSISSLRAAGCWCRGSVWTQVLPVPRSASCFWPNPDSSVHHGWPICN